MGVSVNETTADISMATAMVMANSRNSRPTTSPMKSSGISTATSEMVSEMMVKPICLAPWSAASKGVMWGAGVFWLRPDACASFTGPSAP